MKQSNYVKSNIIEALTFSINSVESVKVLAEKEFNQGIYSNSTIYTIFNRREYLKDILQALNSKTQKLIMLGGFQGTGKTELLKSVRLTLEENTQSFYYECSVISNFEDIILSLYNYLHKLLSKEQEKTKSITEKILNYLKNLNFSLLIIIDGFENLIQENFDIADNELSRFLSYILSLSQVKLVISGKKLPSFCFNVTEDDILHVKLSGLDEIEAVNLLRNNNIQGTEQLLYQTYQVTRGYPESLIMFATVVNLLKLPPFEIIKDYSIRTESFEEYTARKIYNYIPSSLKKIIWLLAMIRHPIKKSSLESLNLLQNLDEAFKYLLLTGLIHENNDFYYIKDFYKEIISGNIPAADKIKIHQFLHEFYTKELSSKLEKRILSLSRKSLNSEQYFHYLGLSRLKKDSSYDFNTSSSNLTNLVHKDNEIIIKTKNNEISTDTDLSLELTEEEKQLLEENNENSESNENNQDNIKSEEIQQKNEAEIIQPQVIEINQKDLLDKYINNAVISKKRSNPDLALSYYNKALQIAKNTDDILNMAKINRSIGNILYSISKYEQAIEYLNKSLDLFTAINDIKNTCPILLKLANFYKDAYKLDMALEYYKRIIKFESDNKNNIMILNALIAVGDIYDYREELDEALEYYSKALANALEVNNIENISRLYFKIALIYDDFNNFNKAMEYYNKCIQINDDPKINNYLSSSYTNIALLYEDLDDTNNAIVNYHKSLDIDRKINDYEGQYLSLSRLGNIYSRLEVQEKAIGFFLEEIQAAKFTNDPYIMAMSNLDLGDFYLAKKQYENALKYFTFAQKSVEETISTDSQEKIDRRFKVIMTEIGERKFNIMIENIRRKYG